MKSRTDYRFLKINLRLKYKKKLLISINLNLIFTNQKKNFEKMGRVIKLNST